MTPPRGLPVWDEFVALVEHVDPDAPHRMPLLRQVGAVLYEGGAAGDATREDLADRLERWRYQILNNRGPGISPEARRLVDWLDVAAATVRNRPRPARAPRSALNVEAEELARALDPSAPFEALAEQARAVTLEHFPGDAPGRQRVLLYAPLYLSNQCVNRCLYCAFRYPHPLEREHLEPEQALAQADILAARGFRHLLLVAGDFPRLTSTDYFAGITRELVARGFTIAVEIAPQTTASYRALVEAGARGVTLYQETYQEDLYAEYHPRGTKAWFDGRLEGPERAAEAGMTRLGLGVLLGLADPRRDVAALIGQGRYLQERFPHVRLAFSLPRIHEAPDDFVVRYPVDDATFLRLYCALRLAFPTAELVLSTRERPALREQLAGICITQMSAGSSTAPGGYAILDGAAPAGEQFPIADDRPVEVVAGWLERSGFAVRWDLTEPLPGA